MAEQRGGRARTLLGFAVAVAGLAGLAGLALSLLAHPHRPVDRTAAVPGSSPEPGRVESTWTALADPAPILALARSGPELALTGYRARQVPETGLREDRAAFGRFDGGPHLGLTLVRGETGNSASHFVEIARRAAEAGLSVVRLGQPAPLPARFSGLEAAEMQLSDGTVTRACLSFRVRQADLGFALAGWSCSDGPPEAVRQQLACLLDRLAPTEADADLALRVAFAPAARRADPACGAAETEQGPSQPVAAAEPKQPRSTKAPRPHVSSRTSRVATF